MSGPSLLLLALSALPQAEFTFVPRPPEPVLPPGPVWGTALEPAQQRAAATGTRVLVYFTALW